MTLGENIRKVRVGKGFAKIELTEGRVTPGVLSAIADRLEGALSPVSEENNRRTQALHHYQMALERKHQLDFVGALDLLEELLRQPFFGVSEGELMCNVADCYLRVGESSEALQWYHYALEAACVAQEQVTLLQVYTGLGHLEYGQERYEFALRHFDRALAISERLPDPNGVTMTHLYIWLGLCHKEMHRVKEAVPCFRLAVSCCERMVNRRSAVWLLLMLSRYVQEMSFVWEANSFRERAATILREELSLEFDKDMFHQYAMLPGMTGDLEEVCQVMQRDVALLEEAGYTLEAGIGYVEVANLCLQVNVKLAEQFCIQALQRLPEEPNYCNPVWMLLGEIACKQERYQEAIGYYQRAANGYKQLKLAKQWGRAMQVLSWIYRKLEGARIS